jgi:hypothetical protein
LRRSGCHRQHILGERNLGQLGDGIAAYSLFIGEVCGPGFTESLLVDLRTHAPHVSAVLVMPGHVRTGMPAPPRSWRRALNSLFADYQPVSSKQAAEAILSAISNGDWRVIIGQDAEAIDGRVRAEPWTVYD